MPERLECEILQKARYINTLTYLPTYYRIKWASAIFEIVKSPYLNEKSSDFDEI